MYIKIPLIKSIMTPFPYSIGIDATVSDAREYMEAHQIHHLPVVHDEKITGIINHRDFESEDVKNIAELELESPQLFDLNDRLDNVLETMADRHVDTVLVTKNSKLVGIFTYTDACRHFASYLREEFGPHDGNDAA
ncbi:MAG: CBS domain-containing protein [Gammaproteobacteria bacterium]|nr:CBS domain-containing protein [Gammaproteobacteria bacterium]